MGLSCIQQHLCFDGRTQAKPVLLCVWPKTDERQLASTNTTSAPPYSPTGSPIFQLSSDEQFAFVLEEILSLSNNGGANTGEVLRIATQIVPSDFESFYQACYYMAEQIHVIAESVNVTIDPVAARDAYFRAATYYRKCAERHRPC